MSTPYIERARDHGNGRRDWKRVAREMQPGEVARFEFPTSATARARRAKLLADFPETFDRLHSFTLGTTLRLKRSSAEERRPVMLTRGQAAYLARVASKHLARAEGDRTRDQLRDIVEQLDAPFKKNEKNADEC